VHQLGEENRDLRAQVYQLGEENRDLRTQVQMLTPNLMNRDMLNKGFTNGQMAPNNFEHLNQVIEGLKQKKGGIITGKYNMTKLSPTALWTQAEDDLLSFKLLAKSFLSHQFKQDVEVVMDEAAILNNPPIANGRGESAQIYHADDISGTGVTFIISLSNDCLSTYCLPVQHYGPEYPRDQLSYDDLIKCDYISPKAQRDRRNKEIFDAVRNRYQPVCDMVPLDFFTKAEGGQIVPAGSYTAFRHDLLHAGPGGNQTRRVLFLHFRIRTTATLPRSNIQYRFDTLMELWRFPPAERRSLYTEWINAGHWSPYPSA